DAQCPGELLDDHFPVRGHVELSPQPTQAVVDEALRQAEEEVAFHGSDGAQDVEAVFEEAVEDGHSDEIVVVGLGRDVLGPGAEVFAAGTAGLILSIVDVEVGDLAIGQGADTTVEGAFAAAAHAAVGAGMGLAGAAGNANKWLEHGLWSWGTGVT